MPQTKTEAITQRAGREGEKKKVEVFINLVLTYVTTAASVTRSHSHNGRGLTHTLIDCGDVNGQGNIEMENNARLKEEKWDEAGTMDDNGGVAQRGVSYRTSSHPDR